MNIKKQVWEHLKPSPLFFVIGGVFIAIAVISLVSMTREPKTFSAKITYENLSPDQKKQVRNLTDAMRIGDDDRNARYAERVREASSIGLGLSMYLVSERVSKNRVLTLPEVMLDFSKSDLLPPGILVLFPERQTSYGLMQSQRGLYYIRYSPKPLKIEVLSGSQNGVADGSAFILRIPDTSAANIKPEANTPKVTSAGAWATLFEAPEAENAYIPAPFAPVENFTAMNWTVRALQQSEMSPERVRELNDFLQKQ